VSRAVIALFLTGLALSEAADAAHAAAGATSAYFTPGHLIYVPGRIVQDQQSARPRHPRFGYYELEGILEMFVNLGFLVHSEILPKSDSVSDSADRVVREVQRLLSSGVPPNQVTVVGASTGARVALAASARLQEPEMSFSVLGTCLVDDVRDLFAREGKRPRGRLLAIREVSDDVVGLCPAWKDDPAVRSLYVREIVLHTRRSHGFLYFPLQEWVSPLVEWVRAGRHLQ